MTASFMRRRVASARRHAQALRAPLHTPTPDWRERRACNNVPLTVFYGNNLTAFTRARTYCDTCPVRADCLATCWQVEHDMERRNLFGVVAGLTSVERWRAWNAPETRAA